MNYRVVRAFLGRRAEQLKFEMQEAKEKSPFVNPFQFVPAVIKGKIDKQAPGVQEKLAEIAFRDPIYRKKIIDAGILDFKHPMYSQLMNKWLDIKKYPKTKALGYPIDLDHEYLKISNFILRNPDFASEFQKAELISEDIKTRIQNRIIPALIEYKNPALVLQGLVDLKIIDRGKTKESLNHYLQNWSSEEYLDMVPELVRSGFLDKRNENLEKFVLKFYRPLYAKEFLNRL